MPRVDCGRGRLLPATAASAGGGGGGMAATDVAAAISGGGMALRRCCAACYSPRVGCATARAGEEGKRDQMRRAMSDVVALFLMMQ